MSFFVAIGNPVPIVTQLGDGATDKHVRAQVYGSDGNPVAGSPVTLIHIANGFYRGTGIAMPDDTVTVQPEAFNDSGFTMPAPYYISARVFTPKQTDGGGFNINDQIPLSAQFGDGSDDLFVLGWLYDDQGVLVAGSPIPLVDVGNGFYQSFALRMPDSTYISGQTQAFTDPDYTIVADQLIGGTIFTSFNATVGNALTHCPNPTLSVAGFKAYFVRDFPYGNTPATGVMDSDISNALEEATCFVSRDLFCDQGSYNWGVLTLAAHFLVMNLRASSQGISGTYPWLLTNKAVGSVSAGYTIPQRILDNPEYAMLSQTYYGSKFLFFILPQLTGQVFTVFGRTNP